MMAALYAFLGLVALGGLVTLYAALTAKEGYEDAEGFHVVKSAAQAGTESLTHAATVRR